MAFLGSSPRVRGKLAATLGRHAVRGLIPACAGKTSVKRVKDSQSWAHPRVCGENTDPSSISTGLSGSSPRVRGKR